MLPIEKKEEEKWNAITHSIAVGYSLFSLYFFIGIPIKVYSIFLVIVFSLSTLYHIEENIGKKDFFRMLDMASIHLLIPATAASYTLLSKDNYVWPFIIIGICFSSYVILFYKTPLLSDTMVKSCILSGSISTAILILTFPTLKILLIFIAGALTYVCGIYFYMNDKKKWFHTIWHIFVIIGSIVHISGLI